jgi:uncharacterized protein (DUF1330 family)
MRPLLLPALLLALCLAGCASEKSIEKENSGKSPVYTVDARDLYEEYMANQVKADKKYKGKVIVVEGKSSNISQDVTGASYVMMNASNMGSGVQCMFAPEHKKELEERGPGEFSIKGKCDGFNQNVILRGCTLR